MAPDYIPPYDSQIEDTFAYHATKYLLQDLEFHTQYEIHTICGNFILDFVAISPEGEKIGFECDGKDFHDASRDEWRDAMILGNDKLDSIYRLRGSDLTYYINNILFILSKCEPNLFSSRGHSNLKILASKEISELSIQKEETIFYIPLRDEDSNQINHILIERRHKKIPKGKRQFWQSCYAFAKNLGGGNLDEIIAVYRENRERI